MIYYGFIGGDKMKKMHLIVNNKTAIFAFLSLATAFVSVAFLLPNSVFADVPDVLNVEPWTSGTETILNITVRHSAPTGSHYIDIVQVDVDGAVNDIPLEPQSTNPFIIQYNMGEVTGEPSVQARAHCTLHGWGSWSEPLVIPEFSPHMILAILAVLILATIYFKDKLGHEKEF
jgi:hypothetical protein